YVDVHSTDAPQGEIRGQISGSAPALCGAPDAPTLSEWMALLFALSMVGVAVWRLRAESTSERERRSDVNRRTGRSAGLPAKKHMAVVILPAAENNLGALPAATAPD